MRKEHYLIQETGYGKGRELRDPSWESSLGVKSLGEESVPGEGAVQLEKRMKNCGPGSPHIQHTSRGRCLERS